MTDPRLSAALKSAIAVWLDGAMLLLRDHADHIAELRTAMGGDNGDVRIVYHMRANAITMVPSGMRLEFCGAISGNMRLSFQAARSIG